MCKSHYKVTSNLKGYFVKNVILIVALTAAPIATPAAAEMEFAKYNSAASTAHCSSEWGSDYAMKKYCIEKIERGFKEYILLETLTLDQEIFHGAMRKCKSEWRPQWDMVAYCAQKQVEGARELSRAKGEIPEPQYSEIFSNCWREWPDDFSMKAYCMKNQAKAWRALQ
jgi:hypothetical protein